MALPCPSRLKAIVAASLAAAVCCLFATASRAADLRVVHSDTRELLLEFRPTHQRLDTVRIGGRRFLACRFDGAARVDRDTFGAPDLPVRAVEVGVPALSGNVVELVSADWQTLGLPPAPVGAMRGASPKAALYAALPGVQGAQVVRAGLMRRLPVVTVAMRATAIDPATGNLRRATRMLVRVRFASSGAPRPAGSAPRDLVLPEIVNADVARAWSLPLPPRVRRPGVPRPFGAQEWARVDVTESGMIRITAADLSSAGMNLAGIDPATIQMFGLGGRELPETMLGDSLNQLRELAIDVHTDAQGNFTDLVFYGRTLGGWSYTSSTRTFNHFVHHYAAQSSYLITAGGARGKRMTNTPATGTPSIIPTTFRDRLYREDDNPLYNPFVLGLAFGSGRENMMAQVSPDVTQTYQELLAGYAGGSVALRTAVGGSCGVAQSFDITVNGQVVGSPAIASTGDEVVFNRTRSAYALPPSIVSGDNRLALGFTYRSANNSGTGAVDWYEVEYDRSFTADNGALHIWAPDTTGTIEYSVGGFSQSPICYDVTDDANVTICPTLGFSSGIATMDADLRSGSAREYYLTTRTASPGAITKITWSDLRGTMNGVTYIIVTDPSTLDAANRLAERRNADNLVARVVTTTQIYNEFGEGQRDVTAIRDFLRYTYLSGGTLRYALLFGDGSWNHKTDPADLVPAYENTSGDSFDDIYSLATDDFYGYLSGSDTYVDIGVGRLCVSSPADANAMVDKIAAYEDGSDRTDWRNRLTFVADDNFRPDGNDGTTFTDDAETMISRVVPDSYDLQKIYLAEYTTVFTGQNNTGGRTKPGAYDDIISAFNNGTLLATWIGHGNPHVWAHEQVFVNETTIPQLHNSTRLAFLTAATCDFGRFDNPGQQSGTELLELKPDGGTIGVLSTSRSVYDWYNVQVSTDFYNYLLNARDAGNPLRLGDAIWRTKQKIYNLANDQKFYLQGDPGLRLRMPTSPVNVDRVNNVDVDTTVIQLRALMHVVINGTVHRNDSARSVWSDFNGNADVTVYDSHRDMAVLSGTDTFKFSKPGGVLYRGKCSVHNGLFSTSFVVPKDISYENKRGKITVYAVNDNGLDAVGSTTNIVVGGTDTSNPVDTRGPVIRLYLDGRTFHPGDLVSAQPMLIADLSDASGINAAGTALGHRIEAWIDDAVTSTDLTPYYAAALDDPTRGTAERSLTDLATGSHVVRVRAWDVYNNFSEAQTNFVIADAQQGLVIANVMPVPNPASGATTFTLQQNQAQPVDVTIKIYTVAGRLVRTLSAPGITQHFVTVPWDGKDEDGDPLGNGTYLYRVVVRTEDGSASRDQIEKVVILR